MFLVLYPALTLGTEGLTMTMTRTPAVSRWFVLGG
jgi:hypothetical protein